MKTIFKNVKELISSSFREFSEDNATQLAAALAYYTIFSLPPILIIVLAIGGQIYSADAARSQLMAQISSFIGSEAANLIETILKNSGQSSSGIVASSISFVALLLGASGLFNQIQFALNKVWGVPRNPHPNVASNFKMRLRSFLLMLTLGFLLLVFLMVSALASFLTSYFNASIQNVFLLQIINTLLLFGVLTVICAMVFQIIPDMPISWADVWLGSGITAFLFMIGRLAIGLYLSFSKASSTYGVAGSLIVLLIWIYYSTQIFLFGAEFTQIYAKKFGSRKNQQHSQIPLENPQNLEQN